MPPRPKILKTRLFGLSPLTGILTAGMLALIASCGGATPELPGQGKWRVVNYWAIWCAPCREEVPELNRLALKADIEVLGVNFDGKTGDELAEHARQLAIVFPVLPQDPAAELGIERPRVLPTTVLVSPEGEVMGTLVGPQTEAELLTELDRLGRSAARGAPAPD